MVDISVIIVSWNVKQLLVACLRSLIAQQGVDLEIIVVDNASTDGTAEYVASHFPTLQCIANTKNRGFAAATNQGIRVASGRNILLLNPDTVVPSGQVARIVQYLDTNPRVGLLGCTIKNKDGSLQRSIRRFPTFCSQVLILCKMHVFCSRCRCIQHYFGLDIDYTKEQDVDQVMGALIAFRRSIVENVGFLDEKFFLWFEEVDYCRRVQNAGYAIRYTPSCEIIHYGGESFQQLMNSRQQQIFNKSLLYYFRKHHHIIKVVGIALFLPLSYILALCEPFIRRFYAPRHLQ